MDTLKWTRPVSAEADSAADGDGTRIVVFGDADFARNQHISQQANGELAAAAVRWLTEGEESLTIPPKQPRFNPINLVVGGLGAPAAGYVRDITGSYDPAWWAGVALMTFGAVLTVLTPPPRAPRK